MARPPLLSRLAVADRAWRKSLAAETLLRSVKWLALGMALVVAADLIAQLGSVTRCVLSVTGAAIMLGWLLWLGIRAFGPGGPLLRIARHLESRDPTLGSKLINVLQLEEQAVDPERPALTRALARRAVDEATSELEGHRFLPLTQSPTLRRTAWRALIPVAVLALPALVFAPIAWREAMRFVDPFGDHPPFSLTHLRIVTPDRDNVGVVYKKPAMIEVEWTGHRPGELFLSVVDAAEPSRETRLPMAPAGERQFVQQIDQVTGDLLVRAQTRNGRSMSEARRLRAILTPQLEKTVARIEPPAYTRRPPQETTIPLGGATAPGLTVLAGSKLDFTLTSNRPLSVGRLQMRTTAPNPLEHPLLAGTGDEAHQARVALAPQESGRLRFDLRDIGGLPSDKELVANLTVTHDLPPEIAITEPAQDGFIVDTFAATVALRASDDYGLKSIRWHVGVNGTYSEPQIRPMPGDPPQRTAVESLRLAPAELGARAGDTVTLFADATDIRPDPQIARSQTLTLEVISEADYNDFLRAQTEIGELERKYADLHDALRGLAREQRDLAAAAAQLANPTDARRDELKAKQDDLNARLEKLADKMAGATRDQPLYDLEKDLQKVLDEQAAAVRESVAANREAADAFGQSPPTAASTESFAEAARAQADRLDPTAEAGEKRIAEALEDAQLMQELLKSLAAFQAAYAAQQQLATQTAPYQPADKPLTDDDRLSLQQMSGGQRAIGDVLKAVASNLRRDADRAESAFPEAAADARDIADAIEQANLSTLAEASARAMLGARGAESHHRAEQLRAEMEKLMAQCGQCQGGMSGEFAQRLKLMRSMLAGQTFSQMAQCRKFGFGPPTASGGGGMGGAGMFGMGTAQDGTPQRSLLGGESQLGRRPGRETAGRSDAKADGLKSPGADLADTAGAGSRSGPATLDRPATSATGDAALDEYREVVDAYFRKLTTSRPTQP